MSLPKYVLLGSVQSVVAKTTDPGNHHSCLMCSGHTRKWFYCKLPWQMADNHILNAAFLDTFTLRSFGRPASERSNMDCLRGETQSRHTILRFAFQFIPRAPQVLFWLLKTSVFTTVDCGIFWNTS